MAPLVLPGKSSGFVRTGFFGLISSAHLQSTCRVGFVENTAKRAQNCSSFITSEVIYPNKCHFQGLSTYNGRLVCSVATESLPKRVDEPGMDAQKEIFLKDYKMPDYCLDTVDLRFSLGEEKTIVKSKITVYPRVEGSSSPLVLDGHDLKLLSVHVNGQEFKESDYHLDSRHLTLLSPPSGKFTLDIVTEIYPQKNTSSEGLYKSTGNFCTHCEAEGFRKITFFQDRPDVMAKYTCYIEGDKSLYPVLLSNGNLVEQGDLEVRSLLTWKQISMSMKL